MRTEAQGRPPVLLHVGRTGARRSRIREHLGQQGFLVVAVDDGSTALAWCERRGADVVLIEETVDAEWTLPGRLRAQQATAQPRIVGLASNPARWRQRPAAQHCDLLLHCDVPVVVLTRLLLDLVVTQAAAP